jgi:hypothetical protein
MAARYGLVTAQSEETHIIVFLNGLRLYDTVMPTDRYKSETVPPDHWLKPGNNELTLKVVSGVVGPVTVVSATLWDGDTNEKLALIQWPHDFPVVPTTGIRMDTCSKAFSIPLDHKRPLFMDAPVTDVPPEGNDALWAPVLGLHGGLSRGEPDPVFDGLEFRAREYNRFYEVAASTPEATRKTVDDRVTAPYQMIPIDKDVTRFEPSTDGRLVCVRRLDGLPVIAGKPTVPDIPTCVLERPILVMNEGRYRILY